MDYERLTQTYRQTQGQRLGDALSRLSTRPQVAATGRVVPGDTDLTLGTGRRLQMAVMFIDLRGFSGRPAESAQEQEVLLRVFDLFFTEMIRIAEDYGGTVKKTPATASWPTSRIAAGHRWSQEPSARSRVP